MPDLLTTVRFVERIVRYRLIVAGLFVSGLVWPATADLPTELKKLVGLASALPPEFQADALLQIVESRGGLDAAIEKDLIERAGAMAHLATNPYPKVTARGVNADSRQAFEAGALALKLDRLSLEMRAVRDMMAFDPAGARQLYQQAQKPTPPDGSCADALIPVLDDYFDMGAQVVQRGFTPKEISRQEHVALLLQIVASVRAPYEVGPAARLIANSSLPPPQFEAALNAFTARLESIAPDDRSFTETGLAAQQEIGALAARSGSIEISSATLARAYRKYLTFHYSQPRCAESSGARIAGTPTTNPADWFNQSELRGELPVIEMKDFKVTEPAGKFRLDAFWSTPDSETILSSAVALRTSAGGVSYSVPERSTTEWNQKLQDFLARLNDWKQGGEESELDFFNEKATVYESLIDLCPAGEGRQRMVAAFVGFLKSSDGRNAVEWFWHAQNVYRRMRQSGDGDAKKLMAAYRGSGNLMLEVYAELNGY